MHTHGVDERVDTRVPVGLAAKSILGLLVALTALGTALGLVDLWPSGKIPAVGALQTAAPGVSFPGAKLLKITPFSCPESGGGADNGEQLQSNGSSESSAGVPKATTKTCAHLRVQVKNGAGKGDIVTVEVPDVVYRAGLRIGEGVKLARVDPKAAGGTPPPGRAGKVAYSYVDLERGIPLFVLALIFAIVVVAVARLRGLFALAGIAVALVVLIKFMLPALLEGRSGFAVGIIGGWAIMLIVLYLAHGPSMRTTTALVGTLLGIGLTGVLGTIAVHSANLTGLSGDDTGVLSAVADSVNLQGLMTCGVILAGLGILNDVTITQSSAVWELRAADPGISRRSLFASSMRIGRDHIASTVYTIVFAYAGATLPVLLLIEVYHARLTNVVVSEAIAEEIVRTLASGVGLVLAVPLTTAIAVISVSRPTPSALRTHEPDDALIESAPRYGLKTS
jgi:uncharacterized membrane protein